ncbi:MAG: glycosyltransferase [Lachnospiraceae bacterium]|nr:glycosyltransferase [Lachnospiraceae bacterium]
MDAVVSVIIPVYNVEQWLDRCVQSVFSQTYHALEIILVDDGSPDKCPQMCDEYSLMDSRVRVIHKENGGLASARNAGLKVSTGEYVFFLDSDDWLELNGLEQLTEAAKAYQVDFVRYRAIRSGWPGLGENAPCMLGPAREMPGGFYDKDRMIKELYWRLLVTPQLTMGPIVGAWGSLYKRDFLEKQGLRFYEDIKFSEDLLFSANVVIKANSFYYIEKAGVYHYFYNDKSISKSFRSGRWEACKNLIHAAERDFSDTDLYDFSQQLTRLRWFCIMLALNERKYISDNKQRKEYCKYIFRDQDVRVTKLNIREFEVSWKQKLLMLLIKSGAYRVVASM